MAMQLLLEIARKLWKGWEIRLLTLLSLFFQIILTIFGSRRKYITNSWVRMLIWLAYLAQNVVVSVALGKLIFFEECGDKSSVHVFWVPFFLLHLGGPDTITAYALEDNDLWLRHFLGLIPNVGTAFCIFLESWRNAALSYLFIPVFIAGTIKYGERTLALRFSSTAHFKASLLEGDHSPYFVQKAMQERKEDSDQLSEAYKLFIRFAHLSAFPLLCDREAVTTYRILYNQIGSSTKDVFNLIVIELGFMYDMIYTKAGIAYSKLGIFVRCISFLSSVFTLVFFSIIINIHVYPLPDIIITYLLLVGAVAVEIYGFPQHCFSDWTKLWLNKSNNPKPCSLVSSERRWSESAGQLNLINYCIKDMRTIYFPIQSLFNIVNYEYRSLTREDMIFDLEKIILVEVEIKVLLLESAESRLNTLLAHRGDHVLQERYELRDEFDWCTFNVEFEYSLLVWHIATTIFYYRDKSKDANHLDKTSKISMYVSDYMVYLLIIQPSLMPQGIADSRFKETCAQALNIIKSNHSVIPNDMSKAFERLLHTDKVLLVGS